VSARPFGICRSFAVLVLGFSLVLWPAASRAQDATGGIDVAVGGRWLFGAALGSADANATTAAGEDFRLFSTRSERGGMPTIEGRIGVPLWRSMRAEAAVSFGVSNVLTRVSSDVEGVPDVTVRESIHEFTVEGSALAELARRRPGARAVPFAMAGVGYLRDLHEGRTVVETGALYHVGAGVTYVLGGARGPRSAGGDPLTRSLGLRADARVVIRTGGASLTGRALVTPAIGASLFLRF